MRICKECKIEKNESDFKNDRNRISLTCRKCLSERIRAKYARLKNNVDYEQGVRDSIEVVKKILEEQAELRGKMGDEIACENYINASSWVNYIDISNELDIKNGIREHTGRPTIRGLKNNL